MQASNRMPTPLVPMTHTLWRRESTGDTRGWHEASTADSHLRVSQQTSPSAAATCVATNRVEKQMQREKEAPRNTGHTHGVAVHAPRQANTNCTILGGSGTSTITHSRHDYCLQRAAIQRHNGVISRTRVTNARPALRCR